MSGRLVAAVHQRVDVLGLAAEARALALAEGLDERAAAELALVIAELGMNAVRHGGGGLVDLSVAATGWTVQVEDSGPGLSPAVLADAGRSDRLGRDGVRPPADGGKSFGSGLASVRRLSSRMVLENRSGRGARAIAQRDFSSFVSLHRGVGS